MVTWLNNNIETRFHSAEVRANTETRKVEGYAAVFDKNSENFGWFVERIAQGSFSEVMADDVRALFNHDPNLIVSRAGKGLKIYQDSTGLGYEFTAPKTTVGNDMIENLSSGLVNQSSFSFIVKEQTWEEKDGEDPDVRTITKIKRLFDVGPVTFPGYPDTTAAARSYANEFKLNTETFDENLKELRTKKKIILSEGMTIYELETRMRELTN